ncbi:hypothetical protein CC1G_07150 [Coprinopsis cinerea okayama7|uniref:CT20 family protein n=1 Tax=Coprinopsis cinerea (strain Okayama-7 / 130 / ATCC MYA-4618 / FGSC 9003) TaxID=240176 RepID=A8NR90_COPC7|nr:hypothetical protein CC1G_07150 [Coprinopsis cinerea okayama7\|eukprot:XP_001835726.1 hypothetical protein CC1G_07150 [Coprinopsis cinerea okayama7\
MTVASTSTQPPPTNGSHNEDDEFLDSVEGEITFFRSIMRARPVGIHRYFHILAIRNAILQDTGRSVTIESLWKKLRAYYNLDALEVADAEHENSFIPHKNAPPVPIPSPQPDENLACHPFFRREFELPYDDDIEALVAERRMRATPSAPSTPPSSPPPQPTSSKRPKTTKKRGKSKVQMAGLVGGDSDSSALTQESGDEGLPETPRDSVITGTDGGTEYGDDEDVEMQDASASAPPRRSTSPKPTRGRPKGGSTRGRKGGTRGTGSTRGTAKKRKR